MESIILYYLGGPKVITRVLKSGRERQKRSRGRGDYSRERWNIAGFEDGGRGPSAKNMGGLQKLGKTRKQIVP